MLTILGVVVLAGVYLGITYNSLVGLKNSAEEAYSTMDVYLKKRYDLVPNLVETVKGYAVHERETLNEVIEKRNQAMGAGSMRELQEAEGGLSRALKSIFALSENYPDLKANDNFINLQNQLEKIEMDILQARKYYNGVVRALNTKCETFPSLIVARIFGFVKREFFQVSHEEERENVKVSF